MEWEEFKKQDVAGFRKIDSLTLNELKLIKEQCGELKITLKEFISLVMKVSKERNLSPNDSFNIVKNKGYIS